MEQRVRQELETEDGDGLGAAPTTRGPSQYHVRKQRESARRKLAGQIKRCEEQQAAYRKEKEALESEMAADPTRWNRELTDRCTALATLLDDEERRWLQLNEQLER
jgi:hypothetical protein